MSNPFFRYADTVGDGSGSVEMNVLGLPTGIYIVKVFLEERTFTTKVLVK